MNITKYTHYYSVLMFNQYLHVGGFRTVANIKKRKRYGKICTVKNVYIKSEFILTALIFLNFAPFAVSFHWVSFFFVWLSSIYLQYK